MCIYLRLTSCISTFSGSYLGGAPRGLDVSQVLPELVTEVVDDPCGVWWDVLDLGVLRSSSLSLW